MDDDDEDVEDVLFLFGFSSELSLAFLKPDLGTSSDESLFGSALTTTTDFIPTRSMELSEDEVGFALLRPFELECRFLEASLSEESERLRLDLVFSISEESCLFLKSWLRSGDLPEALFRCLDLTGDFDRLLRSFCLVLDSLSDESLRR